jgi:putative endonuclease
MWKSVQQTYRRWRETRQLLRLDAVHFPPVASPWSNKEVGQLGEQLAVRYLRKQGCKLLQKNYRSVEGGEADIVVRDGKSLVFIEVKTRTNEPTDRRPRDAVNKYKRDLIRRASRSWRKLLNTKEVCYRYDIMEVLLIPGKLPELNWIRDAFQDQG